MNLSDVNDPEEITPDIKTYLFKFVLNNFTLDKKSKKFIGRFYAKKEIDLKEEIQLMRRVGFVVINKDINIFYLNSDFYKFFKTELKIFSL